jgi:hypothetical protein
MAQPADYSGIPSVLRQRSGACDGVALPRGVMSLAGGRRAGRGDIALFLGWGH